MWQTKKFKKSGVILLTIILMMGSLLIGCGKKDADQDQVGQETDWVEQIIPAELGVEGSKIIAKYVGGEVAAEDFEQYLHLLTFFSPQVPFSDPTVWPLVIEDYIGEEVLKSRALEKGITLDEAKAKELYQSQREVVVNALQGEDMYQKYLSKLKLDEATIQNFFGQYDMIERYLNSLVEEKDLDKAYQENIANFTTASVRHILISTETRSDEEAKEIADQLVERLKSGADFAELANEYTEDPGNVDPTTKEKKGGLYADQPASLYVPEFKKATVELPLNEISEPIKTSYGYHIMRVEKRTSKSFDEVKDQLKQLAANDKYTEFKDGELPGLITETDLPTQSKK